MRRFILALVALLLSTSPALAQAGAQFSPAKTQTVSGAFASSTLSKTFTPQTPRTFYLELTGTGSAVVTVEYLCADGSTYAPEVVATDGGTPTVLNMISYNGSVRNGERIALQVGQAGLSVAAMPGTVTGTVNYAFVPGN